MDEAYQLARSTDPETSKISAKEAAYDSRKAALFSARVLVDGIERTYQEAWRAAKAIGFIGTEDRIRHGVLCLTRSGFSEWSGFRRRTEAGGLADVWEACPDLSEELQRLEQGHKLSTITREQRKRRQARFAARKRIVAELVRRWKREDKAAGKGR